MAIDRLELKDDVHHRRQDNTPLHPLAPLSGGLAMLVEKDQGPSPVSKAAQPRAYRPRTASSSFMDSIPQTSRMVSAMITSASTLAACSS